MCYGRAVNKRAYLVQVNRDMPMKMPQRKPCDSSPMKMPKRKPSDSSLSSLLQVSSKKHHSLPKKNGSTALFMAMGGRLDDSSSPDIRIGAALKVVSSSDFTTARKEDAKKKKGVRFVAGSPTTDVITVMGISDYTAQEVEDCWYSRGDIEYMRKRDHMKRCSRRRKCHQVRHHCPILNVEEDSRWMACHLETPPNNNMVDAAPILIGRAY